MAMKEQKKPVGNGKAECQCGASAERAVSEAASEAALESEEAAAEMMSEEQSLAIAELETKLGEAEAAAEKNRDLYIHAVADLDNYRRKAQREKQELAKYALQPFVEELLPPLDHLDMAIEASKKSGEAENLVLGVEMVRSQIVKILSSHGVEEIKASDRDFDPNLDDCVAHEPSDTVPENGIILITRKGYTYNGRLLRPASVVVSSGKPKN